MLTSNTPSPVVVVPSACYVSAVVQLEKPIFTAIYNILIDCKMGNSSTPQLPISSYIRLKCITPNPVDVGFSCGVEGTMHQ